MRIRKFEQLLRFPSLVAEMVELDLERQTLVPPQGSVGPEANLRKLLGREIAKPLGHVVARRLVTLGRQPGRELVHVGVIDGQSADSAEGRGGNSDQDAGKDKTRK